MSNKAEGQIRLNETKDHLRDTNKEVQQKSMTKNFSIFILFSIIAQIADLEEDMFILRDNLLKEKAAARDEKKRLEDEKVIKVQLLQK